MTLHISDKLKLPSVTCGRNHRHRDQEQVESCEYRFAARAKLKHEADALIMHEEFIRLERAIPLRLN